MKRLLFYRFLGACLPVFTLFSACLPGVKKISFPTDTPAKSGFTGTTFYRQAASFNWKQRDSLALLWFYQGHLPNWLFTFQQVKVSIMDSASGKLIHACYYVSPDYFSAGTNDDWARIPITPMAAQAIADSLHCFLPTSKMVDDIYLASKVKLEPIPMYALRDSTSTMWQHHLMIEGQRKGRKGLIAGIKKDVVLSGKVFRDGRPNRVAIYGWHKPDGKPIQPLYTSHVNWYVDYSHGIRFVHETIYVEGKPMHFTEVLKHPVFSRLLCKEPWCDMNRY